MGRKDLPRNVRGRGNVLSGADVPPPQYEPLKGFRLQLNLGDPALAERVFHALAENGAVEMPLQETCWAARYGGLQNALPDEC
jgi:PhnB protein